MENKVANQKVLNEIKKRLVKLEEIAQEKEQKNHDVEDIIELYRAALFITLSDIDDMLEQEN